MDLVYFIEDITKKYNTSDYTDKSKDELKNNLKYLYSILPINLKNKNIELNDKLCNFIIKSGVRRFQECGYPTINGTNLCERHYSDKFLKKEEKNNKKEDNKQDKIEDKKEEIKISIIAKKEIKQNDIILIKNKYGNILWPNTKLVFKSFKEQIIIGKEASNGEIEELSLEDIEYCKKNKLKIK